MLLEPILQIQSLRATHTDLLDHHPYYFPATSVSRQNLSLSLPIVFKMGKKHMLDEQRHWEIQQFFRLSHNGFMRASLRHNPIRCPECNRNIKSTYKDMESHMNGHDVKVSTVESHFDLERNGKIANNQQRYTIVRCLHCEEILVQNRRYHRRQMMDHLRYCSDPRFELTATWYKWKQTCYYCSNNFADGLLQEHEENCLWQKKECHKCKKLFFIGDIKEHKQSCSLWMCNRCHKHMEIAKKNIIKGHVTTSTVTTAKRQ